MSITNIRRTRAKLSTYLAPLALAASVCIFAACSNDNTAPPRQATVQLLLTDAPFPFDSVARADLFIVRIDGKMAGTDSSDAERNKNDDNNGGNTDVTKGWVTLATPNQSYNLLDLQGGRTVNLGQTTLATGTYRGFRLILDVDKSSITLTNGRVLTGTSVPGIKFPSAGRSGVKIVLDAPLAVTSGGTVFVFDFDLGKSFVMRGNTISQNGLLFKPVIRATARDLTGTISGVVRATTTDGTPVANATIEVLKAGTELTDTVSANILATTKTDNAGAYTVSFLLPATYSIRATPPATSTNNPALVSGVVVTSQTVSTAPVIVLP